MFGYLDVSSASMSILCVLVSNSLYILSIPPLYHRWNFLSLEPAWKLGLDTRVRCVEQSGSSPLICSLSATISMSLAIVGYFCPIQEYHRILDVRDWGFNVLFLILLHKKNFYVCHYIPNLTAFSLFCQWNNIEACFLWDDLWFLFLFFFCGQQMS